MRGARIVALTAALAAALASAAFAQVESPAPTTPVATALAVVERLGTSVDGRPIRARVLGDPASKHRVLVVGCVHGDERAGIAVTKALRNATPPAGTAWWVVDTVNPDRCHGSHPARGNAHGVDLNRNAPYRWRHLDPPGGTHYAGTKPASEPETRAVLDLVRRIHPDVTVWFHQHAALVDTATGSRRIIRAYARRVRLPAIDFGTRPGSLSTWQDHTFPNDTAFVVELPAGAMPSAAVRRHVAAITGL